MATSSAAIRRPLTTRIVIAFAGFGGLLALLMAVYVFAAVEYT